MIQFQITVAKRQTDQFQVKMDLVKMLIHHL